MKAAVANSLWLAGCLPALARFHRATNSVADTQSSILRRILSSNENTEFGRHHRFSEIKTVSDYQRRVPLSDYESFSSFIQRTASGEKNVLTKAAVRLFEPTSGSSGSEKWIPYNRPLQREFQAGIRAWIADLFLQEPSLLNGGAYWSVSPVLTEQRRTPGGIPIGFEEDAAYVGAWQKALVDSVMAVPSAVRQIRDIETFRYITLLFLIRTRNLRLISIWNPTFLSLLVEPLRTWADAIAYDLSRGTISAKSEIPQILRSKFSADARRAEEVRAALKAEEPAAIQQQLWPKLQILSCWGDANSEGPAKSLARLFPRAKLQAKGLLATEGCVSFPLQGHDGSALAICSHFMEFLPLDDGGRCDFAQPKLAHELDRGQRYSVVLTTGGGLYRYHLQDVIELVGRLRDCPMICFVGRLGSVSDWFGEKLNEAHVARILRAVFQSFCLSPEFAMVAFDAVAAKPGYVLFIESKAAAEVLNEAVVFIERALRENFHYNYARDLGQLAALRLFCVKDAAEAYLKKKMNEGQKAGDVKPTALDRGGNWASIFREECAKDRVLKTVTH